MKLKTKVARGLAKVCGAKNRRGTPCQVKQVYKSGRCKFHGGLSTGAKTPEGKRRANEARDAGQRRWRERMKEMRQVREGKEI